MSTLQALRARLTAANTQSNRTSTKDSQLFPFYDAQENTSSTVRFLPDGNPKNDFFWVERQYIKLPFSGVVGQNLDKKIEVQVPCIEMYDPSLKCPIHQELRKWYKDDSLKELAQSYWKKRNFLFQGFVRQSAVEESETPQNPIRRFNFTSQVFNPIKAFLMDDQLEELPTSYTSGLDFIIKKAVKGKFADYSTSNWARRESALTQSELDAIDQYGLFNLSDFIPKRPNDAELEAIVEMFEASVDGQAYDLERWGQFYRPYGLSDNRASQAETSPKVQVPVSRPTPTAQPEPKVQSVVQPVVESAPWDEAETADEPVVTPTTAPTASGRAVDILAMIKARQNKSV